MKFKPCEFCGGEVLSVTRLGTPVSKVYWESFLVVCGCGHARKAEKLETLIEVEPQKEGNDE